MQTHDFIKCLQYRNYNIAILPIHPYKLFVKNGKFSDGEIKNMAITVTQKEIDTDETLLPNHVTFVKVYLYITNECNLACKYCFRNEFNRESNIENEFSLANVLVFIDLLKKRYENLKTIMIQFYGGEPLLKFNFIQEIVSRVTDYCENHRLKVNYGINTNGTLLDEKKIQFLTENNITTLVSLDGEAEFHNNMRPFQNGEPSHSLIIKNIKKHLKAPTNNHRALVVNTTLSEDNMNILEMCKYYNLLGIKNVTYGPILGSGLTDEYYQKIIAEYDKLFDEALLDIDNKTFHKKLDSHYFRYVSNIKKLIKGAQLNTYPACGTGIRHFTLLPNGDVAICPVLSAEKDLILGNVNTVINWDKIDGLLNFSSDKIDPCSKCWIRKFCGGGCFASNYKVNGKLLKPYKQLCNVSKHVVLQSIVLFSKICENHYKEFFLEL